MSIKVLENTAPLNIGDRVMIDIIDLEKCQILMTGPEKVLCVVPSMHWLVPTVVQGRTTGKPATVKGAQRLI